MGKFGKFHEIKKQLEVIISIRNLKKIHVFLAEIHGTFMKFVFDPELRKLFVGTFSSGRMLSKYLKKNSENILISF